ncbi:PadR family transcriptional regulator [Peribacillus simplex]|uniref:PadR family transcriptional regulator n=1 Tax=Peribacillus simplex TaxID=1478 RepID=UPI0011A94A8F|nr:PadR family transcriptional regulator [Peribacillus simplex]
MNTLGYAILSSLGRNPCSGYQLVGYLEVLWPAKHSQIYPLLTKMEKNGLLEFEHIEQTGKPDKKIYSITEKGRETLEKWVTESPSDTIIRDEFLIKMYSIWLSNEENAKKLIQDRISKLEQNVALRDENIARIEQAHGKNGLEMTSKHFGGYILFNRRNRLDEEEISWCKWVLNLIVKARLNNLLLGIMVGKLNLIIQDKILIY